MQVLKEAVQSGRLTRTRHVRELCITCAVYHALYLCDSVVQSLLRHMCLAQLAHYV